MKKSTEKMVVVLKEGSLVVPEKMGRINKPKRRVLAATKNGAKWLEPSLIVPIKQKFLEDINIYSKNLACSCTGLIFLYNT